MTTTKLAPIENLSSFFAEDADTLPRFTGEGFAEHVEAWASLARREKWARWRKAAVAASLVRAFGTRTDVNEGETDIQRFCRLVGIGPAYCSRLARTYRTFGGPLAPGVKELLEDDRLSFKHLLVAAHHSVQPTVALREARELEWSADHLARMLTARNGRQLLDAADLTPIRAADDTDDPTATAWENAPEPRRDLITKPPGTTRFVLDLTATERHELSAHLRAVAAVLGTHSDYDTLLAILRRARAEWAPAPAVVSSELALVDEDAA